YLSVEGPSNKFYGINCRPKLGAKLLDRFFHRRRQVSPPVNRLTHRLFDGSHHFLYCDFTVGSRHSAVASSFSRARLQAKQQLCWITSAISPHETYLRHFPLSCSEMRSPLACPFNSHCAGTTAGAPLSLIMSTRNFAAWVPLAFRSTT